MTPSRKIALEHRRRYGYRRVTAELRRRGMAVNHKRVVRMMREDNLLAVQPQGLRRHHRLGSRLGGLSESGQAHEADGDQSVMGGGHHLHPAAARVRLSGGGAGCVLAQGGRLGAGRTLTARLPLAALEKPSPSANRRRPGASLRSRRAVRLQRVHGDSATAPDSAQHEPPGNPYDNASCESFMKTLKQEEIYARKYREHR